MVRTPPLDRILRGTTVIRASELAPKLVEEGHIAGFEFCTITRQELLGAKEMMEFGGGGIVPIVELDGQPIGEGHGACDEGPHQNSTR